MALQRFVQCIVCFLFLFLASCERETDEIDPVIHFIYPALESLHEGHHLAVKFHVKDDVQLAHVRLALVNTDHVSVLAPVWYYPKTKDTLIEHIFSLPSDFTEGVYRMQVWASDGHNEKFKYLQIQIASPAEAAYDLYYVSRHGQQSRIRRIPAKTEHSQGLAEIDQEVKQLIAGANNGLLYTRTARPSVVQAWSVLTGELVWERHAGMPSSEYTHMFLEGNHVLVADGHGVLHMFNAHNGNGLLTSPQSPDTIARQVYFDAHYIYAAQEIISGGKYQLSLYFRPTAAFYKRFQLSGEVIGVFPYAQDHILLAVKTHESLLGLYVWNRHDETFELLTEVTVYQLEKLTQDIDGDLLLFASNGLGRVSTETGQYVEILAGEDIYDAVRHPLTEELFISRGGGIYSSGMHYETEGSVNQLVFGVAVR